MQITFNLPHVFSPTSSLVDNAAALQILLEALVSLDIQYRKTHPNTPTLYQSGVRYGRTYWWEPIPALYERGFGDCKSLAAALIAEYRMQGKMAKPVFRWLRRPDGYLDFHILVRTAQGFEDPSKRLGMGANENAR